MGQRFGIKTITKPNNDTENCNSKYFGKYYLNITY